MVPRRRQIEARHHYFSRPDPHCAATTQRTKHWTSFTSHESGMNRFPSTKGHMTVSLQREYLEMKVTKTDSARNDVIENLDAPETGPIYFWQIFSLTGRDPLFQLARAFYARVFQDDDETFRNSFRRGGSIDNHSMFFALVLVDAFGGGKLYAGGEERLDDVHQYSASRVMDQVNAERWVNHMGGALDELSPLFHKIDPRIRPALNEFFRFYLGRYAQMFGFDASILQFDEGR